MTMIKVMKPVMQEVEVSAEDIRKELLPGYSNVESKFKYGSIVKIKDDAPASARSYYGVTWKAGTIGAVYNVGQRYGVKPIEDSRTSIKQGEDALGITVYFKAEGLTYPTTVTFFEDELELID